MPARTDEELLLCRQVRGLSKAETLDRYRADPGGYPCDRAVVERNAAWRARVRPSSMTAAFRSKNALNRTSVYRSASGVRCPASRPLRRSQKVIRGHRERNASASERAALVLGAAVTPTACHQSEAGSHLARLQPVPNGVIRTSAIPAVAGPVSAWRVTLPARSAHGEAI